MKAIIRQENSTDFDSVYEVVKAAFLNAEHTDHDEHNLVNRLRHSTAFIPQLSLVAVVADKIVGHILFTKLKIKSDDAESPSLAMAPVSVIPEMQGKGIGGKLILEGHGVAKELGFKSVVVLGHPAYYSRFGYVPASRFGIKAPFDAPEEAFMVFELTDNELTNVAGIVEYPKEFFV